MASAELQKGQASCSTEVLFTKWAYGNSVYSWILRVRLQILGVVLGVRGQDGARPMHQ